MGEYTVIIMVAVAVSAIAATVGLWYWLRKRELNRLRLQTGKMVAVMGGLVHSLNPADLSRVAVIADRLRRQARINGFSLEDLGTKEVELSALVESARQHLGILERKAARPAGFAPPKSWRFEDVTEPEITIDESELDAEAALLLEVLGDATRATQQPDTVAYTAQEVLAQLTEDAISDHVDRTILDNMLPS